MIKRTLLSINFSEKENRLIDEALKKINASVTIKSCTLQEFENQGTNLSKVNLVLLRLNEDNNLTHEILKRIKKEFIHHPIIIVSEVEIKAKDSVQYGLNNIIDVRPLNPLFLLARSIEREISSQHNKYLRHQINTKYKNATYRLDAFLKHTEDGLALIHEGKYLSTNQAYKRIFRIPLDENMIDSPVIEFNSSTVCPANENSVNESSAQKRLNTSLESLPDETTFSALIQTRNKNSLVTTIYKTHCFVNDQLCTQILVHNPDAWSNVDKGFIDLRTFDHETGLYNKRFAYEYIQKELAAVEPHGSLAIILIDDFRSARDVHNIDYVEDILRTVASIITKSCSKNDILARYSDAVFTLFSNQLSRSEFLLNCQKILTEVDGTLFGNDHQYIRLSLSIGAGFIGTRITSPEQLIAQADKACDKASSRGGNQIHVFDSVTTPLTVIIDEEKNTQLIQSAIENERFHALYQPIVDLSEKYTENYAVLLRILGEDNSHIPPDNFILTAEKTGLISNLDEWVLKNTLGQMKEAARQGVKRKFFITLSNVTYRNEAFMETLVKEIRLTNVDASLLVFQINFTDVKIDPTVLKNFITFVKKECGCQIAFDQIGFSQITDHLLKEYSVDYLKLDGTFSQNLLNNSESQQTIKNIIDVTKRNHVKTIAKSVENANTLALLWNLGIDAVQGYFLQKPADTMRFDFDLNH
ncbi:MAG: GGDEF and EAL domain-containing protein [Cycloclasticus sp.]